MSDDDKEKQERERRERVERETRKKEAGIKDALRREKEKDESKFRKRWNPPTN